MKKRRDPDSVKLEPTVEYQVLSGEGDRAFCDVHVFTTKKQARTFAKKGDELRTVTRHPPPASKRSR